MSRLSIIVPVFNVEKYIVKCLKSLVNQTLKDIEIIIVNDGSKDKSEEIIKKYLKENQTIIKYYKKKNGGLSSARNYGLKYATGEYIAFLDSDDYVEKDMYEEMYNLAKKENADMVECDFIWEWGYGKKILDKRREYKSKKEIMKRPRVVAWNKIYKRELLNKYKIRFPEGLIYEDMEFFYKLLPHINNISYINKYFVHYTQREDSITNKQTEKIGDIFKILDNIFDYYKEKNIYSKYEIELKYMSRRILLGSSMKRIIKIKSSHLRRKMLLKTIIYLLKFRKKIRINNKKRICFGITKLGIGGAERVLVDIANELIKDYDITIFTIYGGGELEKDLNLNIKRISLYKKETKSVFIPIYVLFCGKIIYNRYLKGHFDIDIAFLEGPITRIFAYKGNNKKIAWIHNDISKVFGKDYKAKIKKYIDKLFYNKYDQIIFVSEQNKKEFEKVYGNISERRIIYNYINKERVISLTKERYNKSIKNLDNEKKFITVSRLVKQKAIDRLIRVHKRLIDEGFNHKIYVIGDGEEKFNLISLVKKMKVEKTFIFLGKKENPYPYMKQADYFMLLSYFEGYGMVLEEAKILNKTILVTDTAAKEAVKNYDKKLVIKNNEDAIFYEMENVLQGKYSFLYEENEKYNYDNKYLLEQIKNIL